MELRTEVLIIGGGLAGLTSAIHLAKLGKQVLLIEKHTYPQHKVCGEYISNEVLPYLLSLNADPAVLFPSKIQRLQVSLPNGRSCESLLPLGGFGISRYTFDNYLYEKAIEAGCKVIHNTVKQVLFIDQQFEVYTNSDTYLAKIVIGAYGKRDLLDHKLNRNFINQKSSWLAVKAHYSADHPDDLVALHNFHGGYCGVSKVENNLVNVCYLVNYKSFKPFKHIIKHQQQVLYKNKHLKSLFENSQMAFDSPMSISQVSFDNKERVKDHILMIGDTAGLIHPLCGNGMSMAIHAAMLCSDLVVAYLDGKITSRAALEHRYASSWQANFDKRKKTGKVLSAILLKPLAAKLVMEVLVSFPALFKPMIKMTHGKPILTK